MIITRTAYRASLFGGGSDYSAWYRSHGGAVLTCTLDHYCYISLRRMPAFLGTKYRVFWSHMEAVDRREDIRHPGVRGCLEYLGVDDGIEVNHAGDLPARSGLGSSSAFTVGMLHALHAMRGEFVFKDRLAREAIAVEQDVLKETVGIQDQIECAHGGFNMIQIARDGSYEVRPVVLRNGDMAHLEARFMLFFTGIQRFASDIAKTQVRNVERRVHELHAIQAIVPKAAACLAERRFDEFGRLLHETWMLKRELSDKVTTPEIDALYTQALNAGAHGGKVLGAGGGGFMLFYCEPVHQAAVREALQGLIEVSFKFGKTGSQVVLCDQ